MQFKNRRWICLIAGIIIEGCSGIVYAWSVFQTPLIEKYGCSVQAITFLYIGNFLFSAIGFLLLGPFVKKHFSIKSEVFIGSLIYAGSIIASSYARTFFEFFILFGILRTLGMSLVYPVLMSYAIELFPERSGFAGGLITAGFASGAVIWAPLAMKIYSEYQDISKAFLLLGILFLCCMLPLSLLLENTPNGFREEMLKADSNIKIDRLYSVSRREMLRIPLFYTLFIGLTLALSCGNILVSQGSPIVRNLFDMTIADAAVIVSAMSIFNMIGRIFCGIISDRLGKRQTIFWLLCITVVMMLLMSFVRITTFFILCMLTVVFTYGGISSMVANVTAEVFGDEHITENYSAMYCVYFMGSLIGPLLGTAIVEKTASYRIEFIFGCILASIAAIIMFIVKNHQKTGSI